MNYNTQIVIGTIKNYFNKGHPRSIEAKRNILRLLAIKGVYIGTNLALVPLTIHYVNPSQYGIWLTLSSIMGWFSFFDIGFGNGLRNKYAEAKANGNLELARSYVSTTYASLALIFSVVWLFFFTVNFFVDWSKILNAPLEMTNELSKLAIIVFSFFCLQIVFKTLSMVIIADQKPARSAFFDMLGQLLALAIITILIRTTKGSLLNLGFVLSFSPLLVLIIASFWYYSVEYKNIAPSFNYVHFTYAKDILGIGFKFFFIQIASIVIYQTNNVVIARIIGPEDVTIFNVAYKYMSIVIMAFTIIISPYWSAITEAFTIADYLWIKTSVKKLRIITVFLSFAIIFLVIISKFAYHLWIGDILHIPFSVSVINGIYSIVLCWAALNTTILNGIGKITIQLLTYSLGTILHIPIAIILGKRFGQEGVILSACIFCSIIAVFSHIQVNKILKRTALGLWNR
jgi:O-antigen/teichoic acid export membrane protein